MIAGLFAAVAPLQARGETGAVASCAKIASGSETTTCEGTSDLSLDNATNVPRASLLMAKAASGVVPAPPFRAPTSRLRIDRAHE